MQSSYLLMLILIVICNVTSEKEKHKKSINKCCPDGEYVVDVDWIKICKKPNNLGHKQLDFSDVPLYDKNKKLTGKNVKSVYKLLYGLMKNETFNVSAFDYSPYKHNYYLSEEGILYEEIPNTYDWWIEQPCDRFCIDYKLDPNTLDIQSPSFWTINDVSVTDGPQSPLLYVIAMFVSCFFLALTLLVYFLLPGSRVLSELVQMTYVASTLGAFFFLALIMLPNFTYTPETCMGLSYVTYFLLLASFCWMAVMSYDLWCLHSVSYFMNRTSKRKATMRYRLYSLYAWGVPAALDIFLIVTNHVNLEHLPWFTIPNIPNYGCFINTGPRLLYLYIPMTILIISNWIFFFMTSFNLWKQYQITSTLDSNNSTQTDHRTLKNRFFLYLKLSIIMGISWALEVISSFNPELQIWYITDIYNMLIGFSMFMILVCNKTTFKKLKKRFEPNVSSSKKDSVDTELQ